jgi:hypothetical protein
MLYFIVGTGSLIFLRKALKRWRHACREAEFVRTTLARHMPALPTAGLPRRLT